MSIFQSSEVAEGLWAERLSDTPMCPAAGQIWRDTVSARGVRCLLPGEDKPKQTWVELLVAAWQRTPSRDPSTPPRSQAPSSSLRTTEG
jgi:hypothetical protein